jgi:hypothetical protein
MPVSTTTTLAKAHRQPVLELGEARQHPLLQRGNLGPNRNNLGLRRRFGLLQIRALLQRPPSQRFNAFDDLP